VAHSRCTVESSVVNRLRRKALRSIIVVFTVV